MKVKVLGITALFHDSAAAVMIDGRLCAAAEEERFSRKKHDGSVPWRATRACLDIAGIGIADIDCLAYYEDPAAKADRQLSMLAAETRPEVASELMRRVDPGRVHQSLREGLGYDGPIRFVPHHLSHAASAYYHSGFDESAVLVLDAVGEWSTSSYGHATRSGGIRLHEDDRFPHSLGLFYSAVTAYLGFDVNDGEYKTMGLAPLGGPAFVDRLRETISWDSDGAVRLDLRYFDFLGLRRMYSDAFAELIGRPARSGDEPIEDWHADLARSAQVVLEEIALAKARAVKRRTGVRHLCMAGGVALNCVMTAKLRSTGLFEDIFVQPAAGDAGGSVGAAAQVSAELGVEPVAARLRDVCLGPRFDTGRDVLPLLTAGGAPFTDYRSRLDDLLDDVAGRLAAGQVIGWFQGRMEFGPRALGARSILADARDPGMRDRVNALVKLRESFRPFAPAVLAEFARTYFTTDEQLPFMLETVQVRGDTLPAVTHADGSARLQTVDPRVSPRFAALLERFGEKTGTPVLLNTSFNQRGEPIVCSPLEALECFVRSRLDALVLGDVVLDATRIPDVWRTALTEGRLDKAPPAEARELAVYELV